MLTNSTLKAWREGGLFHMPPFWGTLPSREGNAGHVWGAAVFRKQAEKSKGENPHTTHTRNPKLRPVSGQPGPGFLLLAPFPDNTGETPVRVSGLRRVCREHQTQKHAPLLCFLSSPPGFSHTWSGVHLSYFESNNGRVPFGRGVGGGGGSGSGTATVYFPMMTS